jgi:hypothetical protein
MRHIAAAVGMLVLLGASAGCSGSPSPTVAAGALGFHALDGRQIPGTAPDSWQPLAQYDAPAPATDMEATFSGDLAYNVAVFDFASSTDAANFYDRPPTAIKGFVVGALGYAPLAVSTGVTEQSRAVDMRACGSSSGESVSLLPSGKCSTGSGSYSGGVATILRRGLVVVFAGYLPGITSANADPADVAQLTPYIQDTLSLLSAVGL